MSTRCDGQAKARLPVGVQDSAIDVVVDLPLSDGRAGHMEHTIVGLVSWEAVDGRRRRAVTVPRLIVCC